MSRIGTRHRLYTLALVSLLAVLVWGLWVHHWPVDHVIGPGPEGGAGGTTRAVYWLALAGAPDDESAFAERYMRHGVVLRRVWEATEVPSTPRAVLLLRGGGARLPPDAGAAAGRDGNRLKGLPATTRVLAVGLRAIQLLRRREPDRGIPGVRTYPLRSGFQLVRGPDGAGGQSEPLSLDVARLGRPVPYGVHACPVEGAGSGNPARVVAAINLSKHPPWAVVGRVGLNGFVGLPGSSAGWPTAATEEITALTLDLLDME